MNAYEMGDLGKFIRKVRKEKGLRLEDLADDQISTATISNIERGVPHVNREKVAYLLRKLNIHLHDIPELLEENTENLESLQLKFYAIDNLIRFGKLDKAYEELMDVSKNYSSYSLAQIHILKGKYFLQKKEWKKAERELLEAIRICSQDLVQRSNLEALSYFNLSKCSYEQQEVYQALRYLEKGLESYQENVRDPEQVKYLLLTRRIFYLEKLGRADEALKCLEEIWEKLSEIRRLDILLRLYALKADLFRRIKLYTDAIRFAKEGILLATGSPHTNELVRLWTILGTIYIEIQNLDDAETCFSFVREMKDQVVEKDELIRAYCSLGDLYLQQGKTEEAKEVLNQAIQWSEEKNDFSKLCSALLIMGKLMKSIHQVLDAITYIKRAVSLSEKMEIKEKMFAAYYELASCYEMIGEQEQFQYATEKMYQVKRAMENEGFQIDIW